VTHFPAETDLAPLRAALQAADPTAAVAESELEDRDWSTAWRGSIGRQHVGDLIVTPPWLADGLDPARTIVIEPAMAFGTGGHASTRGALRELPGVLRAGDVVADLGCGSAILSIAAARLGAHRVYAIESDADALGNANDNIRMNAVADRVHVLHGDAALLLPLVAPVQLVLANIISSVLRELLPVMEGSLAAGGRAILSGLLLSERAEWHELLRRARWEIVHDSDEGDWWTVVIGKA
jgi:ribosomal protein L11 methyltransferase